MQHKRHQTIFYCELLWLSQIVYKVKNFDIVLWLELSEGGTHPHMLTPSTNSGGAVHAVWQYYRNQNIAGNG